MNEHDELMYNLIRYYNLYDVGEWQSWFPAKLSLVQTKWQYYDDTKVSYVSITDIVLQINVWSIYNH